MVKSQFWRCVVAAGAAAIFATTAYGDGNGNGNNGHSGSQAGVGGVGNDAGHAHPPPFDQTMSPIEPGGGESPNAQTNNQEDGGAELPSQGEDGGSSEEDTGSSGD